MVEEFFSNLIGGIVGAFIVFEGGEGVGKSTQVKELSLRLTGAGHNVLLTYEPGGTPLGEALRQLVKGEDGVSPLSELFLMLAARAQLVTQVIGPALARGDVVVCDRFAPSTIAYQGWGRGLDVDMLDSLNQKATGGLQPDLVVLLDAPVEVAMARKPQGVRDNFEQEDVTFHQRVRDGYLSQAKHDRDRWLVVDATQPPERVAEVVWERVSALLEIER